VALQLNNYINESGVPVAYWKITDYHPLLKFKSVDITMGGWLDKDKHDKGYSPVETKKVRCLADKYDTYFSTETLDKETNPLEQIYKFTKENNEFFANAEDI
jgi:hypothetical protein